jgi:hypothetical protein
VKYAICNVTFVECVFMVRRRQKIAFRATRTIPKKVSVSFETRRGQKVSFRATKQVPKRLKVEFYAKRKKSP